ncbi:TrkH family potassium uptake protein [soil metagenome]
MLSLKKLSSFFAEKFSSAQVLLTGYIVFILLGTVLFMLPVSSAEGDGLSFIDAMFTATSSISGTGLIVVDTGSYFSGFGQAVVALLIQIGNIGYMLFFALAVVFLGKKLSMVNKIIIKESISTAQLNLELFIIKVFKYTLIIEGVAAVLLTLVFLQDFPFPEALWLGVFHSISSFCTAGFSLFPDSLIRYNDNVLFVFIIIITSYLGCCGFFVLHDVSLRLKYFFRIKDRYRLSVHSKVVLVISFSMIAIGTVVLFLVEYIKQGPGKETLLTAFFQAAAAATTVGFNNMDIAGYSDPSLHAIIVLMFIGAAPSGTGGGIKMTVFAIMLIALYTFLNDKKHVHLFKRSIHPRRVARAFSIMLMAIVWNFFAIFALSITENQPALFVLFESVSALGNGGMSAGITGELSAAGKVVLTASMLIGRVGPLIVGYTLLRNQNKADFQYPEGDVLIV